MNFKRIGRIPVCLVLICALLINVSPIKARADVVSGGLVAAGATGAVISVPVAIAIGATLICLGIVADAASENPGALQQLASDVGDALAAAGTYVKDGMVEMYRFVTDTGEAVYYAAADFMEYVRSYSFSSVISESPVYAFAGGEIYTLANGIAITSDGPFEVIKYHYASSGATRYCELIYSTLNYGYKNVQTGNSLSTNSPSIYGDTYQVLFSDYLSNSSSLPATIISGSICVDGLIDTSGTTSEVYRRLLEFYVTHGSLGYAVPEGLSLAELLTIPIDGTSARTWSDTYASRGLYIASGGSQNPDDGAEGNDGWKFLLPLTLVTGATLYAMSQAEQWSGQTPQEFDDYNIQQELTITPAPEFDGYQAIEIAPVPDPNPYPGTGSDPDSGGDSAEATWWQRLYQWLLEIKNSINELPDKFGTYFDSIEESLGGINTAISNVPNLILEGIKSLFVPDADFIPGKVQALQSKYSFLLPVKQTFEDLKLFFNTIGATPPIIYIDLGEAVSPYEWGGRVKFLDLTWFAQYKPVTDLIIAAFLWLWLIWRLLQALPGIIQGTSGMWGTPDSVPDISFKPLQPSLPSGETAGRLGATSPLQPDSRPRLGTSRYSSKPSGVRRYWKHNGG